MKPTIHWKYIIITVVGILLIPLIAMQLTDEVNWSVFDFLLMGTLLTTAGLAIDWVWQRYRQHPYRWLVVVIVVLIFLLIWVELAVGVFGTVLVGD